MPVANTLQQILDYDYNALQDLVGAPTGVEYNIGLVTLTRTPATLEQTDPSLMPWLFQTDGPGDWEGMPSSAVQEGADLIYIGYVRPDATRFPDMSAPEIRRGVMADVMDVLDKCVDRDNKVFDRSRRWEVYDDVNGDWSMFVITESVRYYRTIGS